jgi:pimeloyl-ACP methyl ester carboxylesterase
LPRWAARHRVVSWDYKGHGESEPAKTDAGTTIPALADDLRRVMDAAEVERAVLLGFSMGCQVVLEAWRHMPERIAGLGLVLGPAGRLFETALRPLAGPALQRLLRHVPSPWLPPVFGAAHQVARLPGSVTLGRWLRLYGRSTGTDIRRYVEHFGRLDPHTVSRMALHGGEHDARDVLPTIRVPTLVVVGDRDVFAPPHTVGLPMHAAIPGARLLRIPDGTHGSLFEHPDPIDRAVTELLAAAWGS